jgi:hypothetical protein
VPSEHREPISQLRSGIFQKDGNLIWIVFLMYYVLLAAESLGLDAVLSVGALHQWQGLSGRDAVLGRM